MSVTLSLSERQRLQQRQGVTERDIPIAPSMFYSCITHSLGRTLSILF